MANIRRVLSPLTFVFSQKRLINLTSKKIFLPFYHAVSDVSLPHIKHLYPVKNSADFIQDLEYLCKYFKPVAIDELLEIVNEGKPVEKPVFHLTFDDGLSQFYDVVAPILSDKGIPATVFLNSAFIDNQGLFYRYKISLLIEKLLLFSSNKWVFGEKVFTQKEVLIATLKTTKYIHQAKLNDLAMQLNIDFEQYLKDNTPYLTTEQIIQLQKKGFAFGGHSIDHPIFNELSFTEQKRQVSDCFKALDIFRLEKKYFSFPFNDEGVTHDFFSWLYEKEGCHLSFGISGLKNDAFKQHMHRFPMEGTALRPSSLIKTEYLYYLIKSLIGKNKIVRR